MHLSVLWLLVLLVFAFGICNGAGPKFNMFPNSVALKNMEQQTTSSAADNYQEGDNVDN